MNTTQMSKTLAMLGCAVLIGTLAGCAEAEDPPADPPAEQPSESAPADPEEPEPDPEPSETATTPSEDPQSADPAEWVVDDSAVGPIELGADFEAVLADMSGEWMNDAMCKSMAYWNSGDGAYLISFHSEDEAGTGAIAEITVEGLADGTVGPRTTDGLGVGSTRGAVTGIYPDAATIDAPVGGGKFLRADAASPLFFTYQQDSDAASRVTVTSRDVPSYEACA